MDDEIKGGNEKDDEKNGDVFEKMGGRIEEGEGGSEGKEGGDKEE